jgi:hypothetical protein
MRTESKQQLREGLLQQAQRLLQAGHLEAAVLLLEAAVAALEVEVALVCPPTELPSWP